MTNKNNEKYKRRRRTLFSQQSGRCFWCNCKMIEREKVPFVRGVFPLNMVTIDHLRDRFDQTRIVPPRNQEQRLVAACWECNNRRGIECQRAQLRQELWKRAGHLKRMMAAE